VRLRDPFEVPDDEPPEVPPLPADGHTWRVARWLILVRGLGMAVFILAAIAVPGPGATVAGFAGAALLGAFWLRDLIARDRLSVDDAGVRLVCGYLRRVRLDWPEIERITVDTRSRYGLPTQALEIDAGESIYTFGAAEIDDSPATVALQLNALAAGRLRPR
jgi:hypothetical protein